MDFPLISTTNLWAEHRESRRRGSFRRAFSLIELLVVVAIIALLTSLTLSCVVVIRGSAMGSACSSNQRQMYTGIFAYEIEEDGLLPPSAFHNWDRPYYQLMVAAHYLVTAGGQTNDIKNVLVCAAVKRTNSPPGNGSTITEKNAIWSSTPDVYSNGLTWINTSYCYVADAFSAVEYPDIAGHSIPRAMSSIKPTKALFCDSPRTFCVLAKGIELIGVINFYANDINILHGHGSAKNYDFTPTAPGEIWQYESWSGFNGVVTNWGPLARHLIGLNASARWLDNLQSEPWN